MVDLSQLSPGQTGRVKLLRSGSRRLMDLGFTPGAETACLLAALGGGMQAYRVRGAVIALRRREARQVILEETRHG